MSEPVSAVTAATCQLATGGLTIACLSAMGINPTDMIAGLIGCVVVQFLIKPEAGKDNLGGVAGITIGGMLLASLLAPVAGPWFVATYPAWAPNVPPVYLRALLAATIGGFAPSIVSIAKKRIAAKLSGKEPKDA